MKRWVALGALVLAACGSDGSCPGANESCGASGHPDAYVAFDAGARADGPAMPHADGAVDASPRDAARPTDATATPDAAGAVDAAPRDSAPGDATAEAGSPAADAGPPDAQDIAYCDCMLVTCHDTYHATWGPDEEQARAGCLRTAAALPRAGAPAPQGDFLECRRQYCAAAEDDESACAAAAGNETCR
jgi:hypothetical protein